MLQLKQLQDIKENEQVRKQRLANQIKQNGIIKNKISMIQQNNMNMINKMIEQNKNKMHVDQAKIIPVEQPKTMVDSFMFHQFAQVANNMNKMPVEQPKSIVDSSMFHQFAQVANNMNKMPVEQPKSMVDSSAFHQFAQVANRQFI